MKRSIVLSAATVFAGLTLVGSSSVASPSALSTGFAASGLLGSNHNGIHHVDTRNSRHCHKRQRTCRSVTTSSGKKVQRCTTRRAYCHGSAPAAAAPRGSH